MVKREPLCVVQQESLHQVGSEVAEVVSTDPATKQAELFDVAAIRYGLGSEVLEDRRQALSERPGKLRAEAGPFVSGLAEAKPVLLDLLEVQPLFDGPGVSSPATARSRRKHR